MLQMRHLFIHAAHGLTGRKLYGNNNNGMNIQSARRQFRKTLF